MKKTRKRFDNEYKKRIIQEYAQGSQTADEIAAREGLERGQIYRWKAQMENRERGERFESLVESGHNPNDVRRIMELEDELSAAKAKIADLALANDLLKKVHPNFQSEKKSSGWSELKREVTRSKGRVK